MFTSRHRIRTGQFVPWLLCRWRGHIVPCQIRGCVRKARPFGKLNPLPLIRWVAGSRGHTGDSIFPFMSCAALFMSTLKAPLRSSLEVRHAFVSQEPIYYRSIFQNKSITSKCLLYLLHSCRPSPFELCFRRKIGWKTCEKINRKHKDFVKYRYVKKSMHLFTGQN